MEHHARLHHGAPPEPRAIRPSLPAELIILAPLLAGLALAAQAAFLRWSGQTPPALTVMDVLDQDLVGVRIALGVLLVVIWPCLCVFCSRKLGIRYNRPERTLLRTTMALGSVAFLLLWLPWPGPVVAVAIPAVATIPTLGLALRISTWPLLGLAVAQACIFYPLAAGIVWGLESAEAGQPLDAARELPKIASAARGAAGSPITLTPVPSGGAYPMLRWPTSGSVWLDHRANRVLVEAINPGRSMHWSLSVIGPGISEGLDTTGNGRPDRREVRFIPQIDAPYHVVLDPTPGAGDLVRVSSLLPLVHR